MHFELFIGIDISKLTLDIAILSREGEINSFKIANNLVSLKRFFRQQSKVFDIDTCLICAEHTGHYSYNLSTFCVKNDLSLWLESGAEIKQRSGVTRYKNDKVDAVRIADYCFRHHDKAKIQTTEDESLISIRTLNNERDLYIKERAKYKVQVKDLKGFMDAKLYKSRCQRINKQITALSKLIGDIEKQIQALISESVTLTRQQEILLSVNGVGQQVALHTIIATSAFTRFKSGRQFACHVGVAPFSYESGSSLKSRRKVSFKANKQLKTAFHMAALSAIKMKGEFRDYFERKVAEGKNKMTVINAVRAKIINRIFALIRDDRTHQENYQFNLIHP